MRGAVSLAVLLGCAGIAHAGDAAPERYLVRFEDTVRNETPATLRRVTCELTLPRDGPGQRVLWLRLSPHGFAVEDGPDGARTASARIRALEPGEAVTFAWLAEVELSPRGADDTPFDRAACLADDAILGLEDEAVVQAAAAVRSAARSEAAHDLADAALAHVRRHVRYALDGGWRPAPDVLRAGEGSCSETTFVFVALCRRLGLPARWAGGTLLRGGYAGRAVDTTFHRIAEVYLPGRGFVPVETTPGEAEPPAGGPARMLVLSRDMSSDGPAGLYYHARNSWWAPRRRGRPLPRAARSSKLAYWTAAPPDDVDRAAPLEGLPATHRPSFPRAELVLAAWEGLAPAPVEGAAPTTPVDEALSALVAAGHPAVLRVAAAAVWRDPDRLEAVRAALAAVLDDALRAAFEPLLGREPAVFAAWWARNAAQVAATEPGRLTLRAR